MCKTLALLSSVDERTHCQLSDGGAWNSARAVILQQPLATGCSAERIQRSVGDVSEALARPVQLQPLLCRPRPALDQVLHVLINPPLLLLASSLSSHASYYEPMPVSTSTITKCCRGSHRNQLVAGGTYREFNWQRVLPTHLLP